MEYQIKAIPTTYGGVRFRSRLEAQWAAFFDLAGWGWKYEPFDLDGWAPDFLISGKTQTLVEVKPILMLPYDERETFRLAQRHAEKAFRHAPEITFGSAHEVVVAGLGPFACGHGIAWGVIAGEGEDFAVCYQSWGNAALDYAAAYGSYAYRIGGQYDGDHHLIECGDLPEMLWREAGNAVQWKPR